MSSHFTLFKTNIAFLSGVDVNLSSKLEKATSATHFNDELNLLSIVLNDLTRVFDLTRVSTDYDKFLSSPSKISFVRTLNSNEHSVSFSELTGQLFDTHNNALVEALPSLSIPNRNKLKLNSSTDNVELLQIYRDYLILGAVNVSTVFDSFVKGERDFSNLASITIVESSLAGLAAALSLVDLQSLQSFCIQNSIGFRLIFNSDYIFLQEEVFRLYCDNLPCAINGLYVYLGSQEVPELVKLKGWLFGPTGFHYRFFTSLGTSADELNQVREALLNKLTQKMNFVNKIRIPDHYPVFLAASGPSLDDHLEWLSRNQDSLFIIASGSSVGSLLEKNIRVDLCVQLERGSGVYDDMNELSAKYSRLYDTCLVSSSTSDPNLSNLFRSRLYFHRPLATASCLFNNADEHALMHAGPESANAALEVALKLGFKMFILGGCDFAGPMPGEHRSKHAAGISPRMMNIPMRGSKNKTVYTDHTLSLVRDVFQNTIRLAPDCEFYRLGAGLIIEGTNNINQDDITSILSFQEKNLSSDDCFPVSNISQSTDLDFISNLKVAIHDYKENLLLVFEQSTIWDINLHKGIAPYLSHQGLTNSNKHHILVHRYMRQLLFSSLQPLYHCLSQEEFSREVLLFEQSIDYALVYLLCTVEAVYDYSCINRNKKLSSVDMSQIYDLILSKCVACENTQK